MADALCLAACGGSDLFDATRERFFARHTQSFMKTVGTIVRKRLADVIAASDLSLWRETMAVLCTYASVDEFKPVCDLLGNRLLQERRDSASALLCFICANNVDAAVNIWLEASKELATSDPIGALVDTIEKFTILLQVCSTDQISDVVSQQYSDFSEFLASQGQLDLAGRYLEYATNPQVIAAY